MIIDPKPDDLDEALGEFEKAPEAEEKPKQCNSEDGPCESCQ